MNSGHSNGSLQHAGQTLRERPETVAGHMNQRAARIADQLGQVESHLEGLAENALGATAVPFDGDTSNAGDSNEPRVRRHGGALGQLDDQLDTIENAAARLMMLANRLDQIA